MVNFLESLRRKNYPSFVGVTIFAVIVNPLWAVFDYYLEPDNWVLFLKFRLVTACIHIINLLIISKKKYRRYSLEGIWLLTVSIQVEIALMFPFLEDNLYPYTLGFTLPFIIVTIITSIPLAYTFSAFLVTVAAFVLAMYFRPDPLTTNEIVFLVFFISTSLGVGVFSSFLRYRIERKDYQTRRKLDELKSNFFANITHEFRTPLTLILGPVNSLLEQARDPVIREEYNLIKRNALRLQNLIDQLLDLARMEAGKLQLHAAPQDIVSLSREIFATFESHAIHRNIGLVFSSSCSNQAVYLDFEKYEKILTNLLINAFKFSDDGSEIRLSLSKTDSHVEVIVADEGIGISEDQMEHIFDRFYQGQTGNTRSYEGSGIGLALVKDLVELHHGRISVQSRPGHGAEFKVSFFTGRAHLSRDETARHGKTRHTIVDSLLTEPGVIESYTSDSSDLPRILVVEDNYDMQLYLQRFLGHDYEMLFAGDGAEGLAIAREKMPDLILCDVMMPVMDGFELCHQLKTDVKTSHIPLIMLTARGGVRDKLQGLESGADDYIKKPFSGKELKVRIKNLMTQRRRLQKKFASSVLVNPGELGIGRVDQAFLSNALHILEDNLDDPEFRVVKLAEALALSRGQLHRKFKALVNQSVSEFIRSYRLERAAAFLNDKTHTVGEIAFRVGFNNLSYFSECFKKKYGVPPSEYPK